MAKIQQITVFLAAIFAMCSAGIYSVVNPDGSVTFNTDGQPDNDINSANSALVELLSKPSANPEFDSHVPKHSPTFEHSNQVAQPTPSFEYDHHVPSVNESPITPDQSRAGFSIDKDINLGGSIFKPHLEIVQLVEIFLKFKGELAARFYDIVNDNYDLIRSVYNTVLTKIGTLHTFTLFGIRILRKILEFAVGLMAQWHVSVPSGSGTLVDITSNFLG